EANYALLKFAREVIGTENHAVADAFSLAPFFENLGAPLATHRDLRFAKTIILIGGEPEELQPLTGKQIRQAVRNGGARLIIFNSVPIRLKEQAAQFIQINPGTEDAVVLALAGTSDDELAAGKLGIEAKTLADVRRALDETEGDCVLAFGGELSAAAQMVLAQLPQIVGAREGRRFLLHPLPLYNNSIGAHDIGLMNAKLSITQLLDQAGQGLRVLYCAGSLLPEHLRGREEAIKQIDLIVVQELFETETTALADVVFPAASFAETDGTFTNNAGQVQRVRQSIPPVHQARPDWMITAALASALNADFGFQMSASAVFRELAERVPAYEGLRYPLLKDESQPVQVKHALAERRDVTGALQEMRTRVQQMNTTGARPTETPKVGHELFKPGTLTSKTPQFPLLYAGNPKPPTVLVSPLYQITVDENLKTVSSP
ncbi:MAG TPA: molybdopterin-dependent oxidoreductase, partial [Pyrinomonadaceae bacterium]|nr:molybdopterin-dependent oxidoreductase [Pyrinomonadaceae bacterium]